eukprot:TRINITY_DN22917_c0_g1_i1.p1 TRINITY_DN22917_c0_g1~~TRINITY_DN22917_c0_g1_i1.p1  ORF type:complete len:279 (-),score=48.82 TRINITY_DN22917_c0_g1_i1:354-1190(-)
MSSFDTLLSTNPYLQSDGELDTGCADEVPDVELGHLSTSGGGASPSAEPETQTAAKRARRGSQSGSFLSEVAVSMFVELIHAYNSSLSQKQKNRALTITHLAKLAGVAVSGLDARLKSREDVFEVVRNRVQLTKRAQETLTPGRDLDATGSRALPHAVPGPQADGEKAGPASGAGSGFEAAAADHAGAEGDFLRLAKKVSAHNKTGKGVLTINQLAAHLTMPRTYVASLLDLRDDVFVVVNKRVHLTEQAEDALSSGGDLSAVGAAAVAEAFQAGQIN